MESCIDLRNIVFPLVLRSRKRGDSVDLPEGRKLLKHLFNDWGVAPEHRWRFPIVEDRRGVIGVLGRLFGEADRFARRVDTGGEARTARYLLIRATEELRYYH